MSHDRATAGRLPFVLLTLGITVPHTIVTGNVVAGDPKLAGPSMVQASEAIELTPPDLLDAASSNAIDLSAPVTDVAASEERILLRLPEVATGQSGGANSSEFSCEACAEVPARPKWLVRTDAVGLQPRHLDFALGGRLLVRRQIGQRYEGEIVYCGPHIWREDFGTWSWSAEEEMKWHQAEFNVRRQLRPDFVGLIGIRYWRTDYRYVEWGYWSSSPYTYAYTTNSLGLQLGGDWTFPICERFRIELSGKGAIMDCHYSCDDNFYTHNRGSCYQVLLDSSLTGFVPLTSWATLRGGYQCLLNHDEGQHGVSVIHGPFVGLEFVWP